MKNRQKLPSRLCALLLAMALLCSFGIPQAAATDSSVTWSQADNGTVTAQLPLQEAAEVEDVPAYQDTDSVRVSIFLEDAPAISKFDVQNIAENQEAVHYRANLESRQVAVAQAISAQVLGGKKLDVVWNLTLAANVISANVEYGKLEQIEKLPGVEKVLIETRYAPAVVDADLPDNPNMSTSSSMIGSSAAWAAGFTGAGCRIAVIDTGTDTDHQSFSAAGFDYSLNQLAKDEGKTVADYDLLDVEEISKVRSQLHVPEDVTAEQLYVNTKLPFGYNYVDNSLELTHDADGQGEHGSHVAGIATANAYIPNEDGTFSPALDTVKTQGVAPDAQLITMKVFGKGGGAYESDYLVAIEDAIVLKCDAVNLSLGSAFPGATRHSNKEYQAILDNLVNSGVVVTIAAGNAGSWVENAKNGGYLYADDVSMDMTGSPGSYTNSLCVASADNAGATGEYFTVGDHVVVYTQNTDFSNEPMSTLLGDCRYVYIDGVGTEEEFQAIAEELEGSIAVCARGTIGFSAKANAAVANGAIGTIIYNNQPGAIRMDLSDYEYDYPCVSVTQADGAMMKSEAKPVKSEEGTVLCYVGELTVAEGMGSELFESKYYTMSSFSSWGIPGSLEMKPEIAAPGGDIYSVNGLVPGGTSYENMSGTSMATPQVAGMSALVAQHIRQNDLTTKTGLTPRQLIQSLLMSTAVPQYEDYGNGEAGYYPILRQGAGLANVGKAIAADSYILMGSDATKSYADGKVKVELGDDPQKKGQYAFSFSIHNLTDVERTYELSADFFTQDVFRVALTQDGNQADYMGTWTTALDAQVTFDLGQTVKVPANGSQDVHVTVTLTDEQKKALNENYPSGAYLEGYVYAKSEATPEGEEGTTHSIPVLGFYGSWSEPSMFDVGTRMEYESGDEVRIPYLGNRKVNTAIITYGNDPGTKRYFGGNPVVSDPSYKPERNAINSENGDQIDQMTFAAIRNAAASRVTVKNLSDSGKLLLDIPSGAVTSAFYYTNQGSWQYTSNTFGIKYAPKGVAEGSKLEMSLTLAPEYYVDEQGNVNWDALDQGASMTIPMVVDNTAPELLDVSHSLMGSTLTVKAKDNQYVAAVTLYNAAGVKVLAKVGAKADIQPGAEAEYTLDITGVNGKSFLLQVVDYAMNTTTYQINMQAGGEQTISNLIAFDAAKHVWLGFDKENGYGDAEELASSKQTYRAATDVDGMIFASTDRGGLYVLSEEDPSLETHVANMDAVLTDMAYDSSTSTLYGVSGNHLFSVDKLTGALTDIGEIPIKTNTLACDGNGTFYSVAYGDSEDVSNRGCLYAYTLAAVQGDGNLDFDFDGDGNVDADDGQAILDYATGVRDTIQQVAFADLDGNGDVTSRDAYLFFAKLDSGELGEAPRQITSKLRKNNGVQALEWNPNDGHLYWIWHVALKYNEHAYLMEIDPVTGAETRYKNFLTEFAALVIPQKSTGGSWSSPTDKISGIQISVPSLTVLAGSSKQLSAVIQPWTATDRSVIWTSDHEEIAQVDGDGVVTGIAAGQAVITAASKLDPTVKASCTVTVETLDITLKGALQNKDGTPMLFSWNMAEEETWTPGVELEAELAALTYDPVTKKLYVQDSKSTAWLMHQVDPATGKDLAQSNVGCGFGFAMSDLSALEKFNTAQEPGIAAVAQAYLLKPCDPMENNFTTGWDMASYLAQYTGGTKYVALASMGTATNDNGDPCDVIYVLDDAGYLWDFRYNGTNSISFNLIPTDLKLSFPTFEKYQFCSMVQGDDGNLYLSYFTEDTNEFYRLVWNADQKMFTSDRIGDVGSSVWPAALYAVETNEAATSNTGAVVGVLAEPEHLEAQVLDAMVAASAEPMSHAGMDEDEETVTVTVTAKNGEGVDTLSNNGMAAVSYDASALELQEVAVSGDYTAKVTAAGTVTFGYVSKDGIAAGAPVATLTFAVKAAGNTTLTVAHQEINDAKLSYVEQLLVNLDCPSEAFTDLDTACWYHEYTDYVIAQGFMKGVGGDRFAPDASLTRGQLVTTLYRLAGEPEVKGKASFADVPEGQYFSKAVAWAESLGIVRGMTATTFAPAGKVTREQAATFLYRYVTEYLEQEPVQGADLKAYTDGGTVQNYAKEAMGWGVAAGFFEGYGDQTLRPATALTRAQIAKLLTILDKNF